MVRKVKKERIPLRVWLLAIYILILPFATALSNFIGGGSAINYVAAAYVLVCFLDGRYYFKKNNKFTYVFFFFNLLSIAWGLVFDLNWYVVTFLLNTLILFFTFSHRYTKKQQIFLLKAVLISSFLVCIVAVANLLRVDLEKTLRLEVMITSVMDPNDFACGLMIIISLYLTMLLGKKKVFPIIMLILMAVIILLTGSRGGLLTAFVICFVWLIYAIREGQGKIPLILIGVFLVAFILFFDYLPEFIKSRADITSVFEDGGSGRSKIWMAAFKKFEDAPLLRKIFGYGYGSFKEAVYYIAPGHTRPYESHNMWINALIETGVVGLVIMIAMFIEVFNIARKNNNKLGVMCLIGLAVAGCTLDMQAYRIFPIVIILATVLDFDKDGRNIKRKKGKRVSFDNNPRLQRGEVY